MQCIKLELINTDNSMLVTRGKRDWEIMKGAKYVVVDYILGILIIFIFSEPIIKFS